MDDSYLTIDHEDNQEIKVKGSRFIGRTRIVKTVEEVQESLNDIRKKEYAATHNCYAWTVGHLADHSFKYSDDGEPSGTAGKPIYDSIVGRELRDILVVVTRYYGGTKLGTGGLVRAYSDAAILVLEASGRKTHYFTDRLNVTIAFPLYNQLLRLFERYEVTVGKSEFTEEVNVGCSIRKSRTDQLKNAIIELSNGKAEIKDA